MHSLIIQECLVLSAHADGPSHFIARVQVCLFSYGQTGAGKTHTMQGSRAGDGRGIIPRAILKVTTHHQKAVYRTPHCNDCRCLCQMYHDLRAFNVVVMCMIKTNLSVRQRTCVSLVATIPLASQAVATLRPRMHVDTHLCSAY